MSSNQQPATNPGTTSKSPTATWALMATGLPITLFVLFVGSDGSPQYSWLLAAPAALGLIGAFLAARNDRPGWMIASGIWGIALIPAVILIVTLVSGP